MLFAFTSSHRTAGFDLLERLERKADDVTAALRAPSSLSPVIAGSVVLATCNRFETYLDLSDEALESGETDAATLLGLVAEAAGVDAAELAESSETLTGDAVATHLFSVSSGLESVVVGEGEIAGQVRRAYTAAAQAGAVTRDLERLFQGASRTSRGVKNGTGLQRAGRSMVRLALDLAESRIADWSAQQVLLVGTGRYAAASLAALRDKGVTDVAVYSRTGRAEAFALKHGIAVVPAGSLTAAVAASDLVITCSVAPTVILGTQTVLDAVAMRGESGFARRPAGMSGQLVIDLGLPRNVDPAVAQVTGVELLDLETISLHAPLEELQATDDAREIVGRAAAEFAAKSAEKDVEPALIALRRHVFGVLEAELERNAARDESGDIARALRHLAGVLLHQPSVRARELAHDGDASAFVDGVTAVFGIQPDEASQASQTAAAAASERDGDASEAGSLTA